MTHEMKKLKGPIVVFGAGGFIGSNLFRAISGVRDDCYAVTHQPGTPYRLRGLPADKILRADLLDKSSLEKVFAKYRFKTIFNLSTYGSFENQDETVKIFETNIMGLANLVGAAERHGFDALVQGGSSSEYGLNSQAPKESDELKPNSAYAVSKIASSYFVKYLGEVRGLPVIQLRYYSVYGPYESSSRLIPALLTNGIEKKYPPLTEARISRDYVYVDDAVEATIRAATIGLERNRGESLNIAGQKTTLGELVGQVKSICGIPGEPVWGGMPNRAWDLTEWYG